MALEIKRNWLYSNGKSIEKIKSGTRTKHDDGKNICDFLIYHFTGSHTASSAHSTYQNPDVSASWHITIDRDGSIYQLMDFRKIAWHAGKSYWQRPNGREYKGLNRWSIGIEMINAGRLSYDNGQYNTWYGQGIHPSEVYFDKDGNPWHSYTQAQINSAVSAGLVIAKQYNCVDILGHSNISPGRKVDPGPAFANTLNFIRNTHLTRR